MGIECERKFLVEGDAWKTGNPVVIRQGYLCLDPNRVVRVRLAGEQAFLTVKGMGQGISRQEFEYEIPYSDGQELLALCGDAVVDKRRHTLRHKGHVWEVDEFSGANQGLILAEIELTGESESFANPSWLGREVTGDSRYYNACLAAHPYGGWIPDGS